MFQLEWMALLGEGIEKQSYLSFFYNQIYYAFTGILGSALVSAGITMIWLLLLQTMGDKIIIFALGLIVLLSFLVTGCLAYSLVQAKYLKSTVESLGLGFVDGIYSDTYLIAATSISAFISLAILVVIYVMRKFIKLSARIVKEAGKALWAIAVVPMFALLQVLLMVLLTLYFICILGLILSTNYDNPFLDG